MRLIVLGRNGSFPGPGGACSGYLIEQDGKFLLVDAGSGVISRCQKYCDPGSLQGIALSHLHYDHCGDIFVLKYGLETRVAYGENLPRLPLALPATPADISAALGDPALYIPTTIREDITWQAGPFELTFTLMPHSAESYAMRITAGGRCLAYSGDTTGSPRLAQAAANADLFLCESTRSSANLLPGVPSPHLTARLAAETALQAGAKRLLLTHFWYQEDPQQIAAEAALVFPNVEAAEEGQSYEV